MDVSFYREEQKLLDESDPLSQYSSTIPHMSEDIIIHLADDGNQWENLLPELLNYLNDNFLQGYYPLVKLTCKKWSDILMEQRQVPLTIFELAEQGYLNLLRLIIDSKWHSPKITPKLLPDLISYEEPLSILEESDFVPASQHPEPAILEMLLGGASGGHLGVCVFARDRGANDFTSMLIEAAAKGQEHICYLAKEWIDSQIPSTVFDDGFNAILLNRMLYWASRNNQSKMCQLARNWGASDPVPMLRGAATGGHINLCKLAQQWIVEMGTNCNYDEILELVALNGHLNICDLIRSWGARNYVIMLNGATLSGSDSICRLAKKWLEEERRIGLIDYDEFLASAAQYGHIHICDLAKEWGATNFDRMLLSGAQAEKIEVCKLAREWGARFFDSMLLVGTRRTNMEICRLAKEWGATFFNGMLSKGAQQNDEKICILAKEWGANNFNAMLRIAIVNRYKKIIELAITWGGRLDPENEYYSVSV